jgi:uroporphyrin-III C-methyltransferase
LREAGLDASTPIAVVQDASLARERQLTTTLGRLAQDIAVNEIGSPAIMVIGEVARAREERPLRVPQRPRGFTCEAVTASIR